MMARTLFIIGLFFWSLHAGIVVVVSEHSPLYRLSQNEVRQLFLNNLDGRAVAVEGIPNELQKRFYDKIAGKSISQLRAYRARQIFSGRGKPPRRVHRNELESYMHAHPNTVTYIEDSHVPGTFRIIFRLP